jgi:hypothetical protein
LKVKLESQCRECRVATATAKPVGRDQLAKRAPAHHRLPRPLLLPQPRPAARRLEMLPKGITAPQLIFRERRNAPARPTFGRPVPYNRPERFANGDLPTAKLLPRTATDGPCRRGPYLDLRLGTRTRCAILSPTLLFHFALLFHSDSGDEPCAFHRLAPAWRRGVRTPSLSCGRPRSASASCRRRSPALRASPGRTTSSAVSPASACCLCAARSSAVAVSWVAAASRLCAAFRSIGAFRSSIASRLDLASRSGRQNAAARSAGGADRSGGASAAADRSSPAAGRSTSGVPSAVAARLPVAGLAGADRARAAAAIAVWTAARRSKRSCSSGPKPVC